MASGVDDLGRGVGHSNVGYDAGGSKLQPRMPSGWMRGAHLRQHKVKIDATLGSKGVSDLSREGGAGRMLIGDAVLLPDRFQDLAASLHLIPRTFTAKKAEGMAGKKKTGASGRDLGMARGSRGRTVSPPRKA